MAKNAKLKTEICEVQYVDIKKIWYPKGMLSQYPGGLTLPTKDNLIKCTAKEKEYLLKLKSGKINCFIDNKKPVIERKSED